MLKSNMTRICLLYGDLVTKILEHASFNNKGEDYEEDVTKIGKATLGMKRHEIITEKKTPKESKEVWMNKNKKHT